MNDKYKKNNIKPKLNILLMCCIILSTWFLALGYAAINSIALDIKAKVSVVAQDGIFITDASLIESRNIDVANTNIVNIYKSMLQTNVALSPKTSDTYAKYKVVIHNSTDSNYCFIEANSEGLYTNENIKFELEGIGEGTILNAGGTIEFYVVFKYDTNTLPNANTLQSYIDFVFKKAYKVTYENMASNSYKNYAVANETFSVSFGYLDAPIEVKVNGIILNTNNYTYNNYTLQVPDVNGDIHIRKLKKYVITNLVKNGSFENNLEGWSASGNTFRGGISQTQTPFGSKICYRAASGNADNFLLQQISDWQSGHVYYYFGYAAADSVQTFSCDVTNRGYRFTLKTTSEYEKGCVYFKANFSGSNSISVNYAETTGYVHADGIGLVDLTAAFGDDIPDWDWCKKNIGYFDGTTTVYK